MSSETYVCVSITIDDLKLADPQGWRNWADETVHAIELCGYVDPTTRTGTLDLVVWPTNRVDSKRVHDSWVQVGWLPPSLRQRIVRECGNVRVCVYAAHTFRAGRVYTGDDIESNDDIEVYERESREDLIGMAAEWASRSGAVNAHTIRSGRNILDHLDVIAEDSALGIIEDMELAIGTADLAWCRIAIDIADGDHLTPRAMQRLSSDPRRHTETSLRSALIMLGCREVQD